MTDHIPPCCEDCGADHCPRATDHAAACRLTDPIWAMLYHLKSLGFAISDRACDAVRSTTTDGAIGTLATLERDLTDALACYHAIIALRRQ